MVVTFITDDCDQWSVEMTKEEFDFLAVHKPLLDGDSGTEVYVIKEIRFDLDKGAWNFWIITDAQDRQQKQLD